MMSSRSILRSDTSPRGGGGRMVREYTLPPPLNVRATLHRRIHHKVGELLRTPGAGGLTLNLQE